MNAPPNPDVRRKARYHHGDLREALIQATRQLLIERGADSFSLSDACRLAGVSTAAPYKHFRHKDEILQEIVVRGFDDLAERTMEAVRAHGEGTLDGIRAMGVAYVDFARSETAVFRLMFGQNKAVKEGAAVTDCGRGCFGKVIEQVGVYCARHELAGEADKIALALWTFVHGAASLVIDEDYQQVAPGLDVNGLIAHVTPQLLSSQDTQAPIR